MDDTLKQLAVKAANRVTAGDARKALDTLVADAPMKLTYIKMPGDIYRKEWVANAFYFKGNGHDVTSWLKESGFTPIGKLAKCDYYAFELNTPAGEVVAEVLVNWQMLFLYIGGN